MFISMQVEIMNNSDLPCIIIKIVDLSNVILIVILTHWNLDIKTIFHDEAYLPGLLATETSVMLTS